MMDETTGRLLRDVLLFASAFSVGSALFTATLCLRMYQVNPRRYGAFAAAKIGYAMVVGTVLIRLLLPVDEVEANPWSIFYALGLAISALGFVGVGRAIRAEYVAWEAHQQKGDT
jgi:hypothetical protein